jgi:hypothetical protein
MQLPPEAFKAACTAVGITPGHVGACRYFNALQAALPFIELALLQEVCGPCLPVESNGRTAHEMGITAMAMSAEVHSRVHASRYEFCPACSPGLNELF